MSEAAFDIGVATVWLQGFADRVTEEKDWLTELDAAIGDADHGINMTRGMSAVAGDLPDQPTDLAALFKRTGMKLVSTVGGASGPLYGTFFLRMGAAAGDATSLDGPGLAAALRAGCEGIKARGKAELGEKTMLDAMMPALEALDEALDAGQSPAEAMKTAAEAAATGREATIPMLATKGRASYLGERSIGHLDPGAASSTLLFETLAAAMVSDGS
ncbi:MAG TPA: dihydroxyacetone kinase subunit DhaL [Nocardioidaceae bacterium]|nr:dihydroxyacetone kinase subunit DhaL [Nocardioidaceae bacterium]